MVLLDSSAEQSTDIFVLDARGWKFSVLSQEYRSTHSTTSLLVDDLLYFPCVN